MHFFHNFANAFGQYFIELWFAILIGFLISGIFNEFIPTDIVKKHLGRNGIKPILIAAGVGALLPVCCFGSLPIVVTMHKKGAKLGPSLAFLVATPATSVSALIVAWRLLGGLFTVYIFWSAIFIGLVMGLIGNRIRLNSDITVQEPHEENSKCCHDYCDPVKGHRSFSVRVKDVLRYAFVTLPKEIGLELLIGIAVASLVVVVDPIQLWIKHYLQGGFGYLFSLIVGLATYVCSTASVPMAHAFIKSGMTPGPAMVYLLAGPITSYGMIFVIKKKFGTRVLVAYLIVISFLSLLLGIVFDILTKFLT